MGNAGRRFEVKCKPNLSELLRVDIRFAANL